MVRLSFRDKESGMTERVWVVQVTIDGDGATSVSDVWGEQPNLAQLKKAACRGRRS